MSLRYRYPNWNELWLWKNFVSCCMICWVCIIEIIKMPFFDVGLLYIGMHFLSAPNIKDSAGAHYLSIILVGVTYYLRQLRLKASFEAFWPKFHCAKCGCCSSLRSWWWLTGEVLIGQKWFYVKHCTSPSSCSYKRKKLHFALQSTKR